MILLTLTLFTLLLQSILGPQERMPHSMSVFLSALLFCSGAIAVALAAPPIDVQEVPADSDVGLDMVQIVQTRGYDIETYYATTTDGYILTMFRIPRGKGEKKATTAGAAKPVCLLQHGLLDSSFTWVNNFENESLAYILADSGYDVWFGNNRGNRYGRNHTTLNPDDGTSTFWDFTWDEMAAYDVPAFISLVTETTGATGIAWVGHSEGTIQMFAAASETNPSQEQIEALSKVKVFAALAPVAYVSDLASKVIVALAKTPLLENLYADGVYELLPYGPLDEFASQFCRKFDLGCDFFLMAIAGPSKHLNTSRIQKYDFGSEEKNVAHYGQAVPPLYDLSKLSIPTALFAGGHDYLADPKDVQKIVNEAPSDMIVLFDEVESYAHLDYTWGFDANVYVYAKVLDVISKYI